MSSAKKLQNKLFGGQQDKLDKVTSSASDTKLKLHIPKPAVDKSRPKLQTQTQPQDGKTKAKEKEPKTPREADGPRLSYRERLIEKLQTKYESVERYRLQEDEKKDKHWKRWGPYLSERQWATVREDYSGNGDAWSHFPHSQARSRAYRWGEDGMAGISDNHQRLCFALALWNGKDPILKERMFGVTGHQGNHGEDCKELYYYLDSTPTHSYMKYLYKYPQRAYPYEELVRESGNRGRDVEEFEITDTDAFDEDRYWDVFIEYAKDEAEPDGISIRITAFNRGPDPAPLHIIPQLWFPNTWSWPAEVPTVKPEVFREAPGVITAVHHVPPGDKSKPLRRMHLYCDPSPPAVGPVQDGVENSNGADGDDDSIIPSLLFTENDTNFERLYGGQNKVPYVKDAFHDHIIPEHRPKDAHAYDNGHHHPDAQANSDSPGSGAATPTQRRFVNPLQRGTKAAAHYHFPSVPGGGGCAVVRLKLTPLLPPGQESHKKHTQADPMLLTLDEEDPSVLDEELFDEVMDERRIEADEFYARLAGPVSDDLRGVMRQALGGMLWSKQYYRFIQSEWLKGDPGQPAPPPERKWVRNREWKHLHIADVLSMPDKWEYPFFAAWDTAFHCIPLAVVDPAFAKKQLDLLTREWYMKPDGQIPAYEWNFSDVNPPVHAWATFRVFKIERKMYGKEDVKFLERVFQKLMLNFTWWVNRKDSGGNNVFEGGFLGLDNIGAFNRSEPLPTGGTLRQADGTAWMAFYCLNMLNMALELAKHNDVYEDIASKFFEHFIFIADAMTFKGEGENELSLWNEEEGMYFDAIQWGMGHSQQLPIRSLVGLIPLYATLTLEPSVINRFPGFKKRMEWFIENRPEMSGRIVANMKAHGIGDRRLLALASKERLVRILEKMLDESEFFSDFGIRSLSLYHKDRPYTMHVHGQDYTVGYWPGDSHSGMFGGNSNWRGPIWLATNFLLIESLQRFHQYYGSELQVECPTGSGDFMDLAKVAEEIQHRIIHIFGRDADGRRATNGGVNKLDRDPHFRDYVHFYEFFHGNTGKGLGASHQTGWTGLVAYHIIQSGISCRLPRTPRTPRSLAHHYFDETIGSAYPSTPGGSAYPYTPGSAFAQTPGGFSRAGSEAGPLTLDDISPDAL